MHPQKQAVLFGLEMPSDDFAKELRVPLRLCPRVTYSASVALAVTVRHIELEPVAPSRAFVLATPRFRPDALSRSTIGDSGIGLLIAPL